MPTDSDVTTTALERSGAWPARVTWVALAVVSGPTLTDALDRHSTSVRVVVLALAALAWTAALVSLLVARTVSLTAARLLVPTGPVGAVAAVLAGSTVNLGDVVTVTLAVVAAVATAAPWVTDAWVDGSSYGTERRVALRTPAVFAFVMAPLTWMAAVAGAVAGPLLLAAHAWAAGALAVVVGWPLAYAAARALHQLARRWVVLVPSGMVLHDPLVLPEPQLFPRTDIARLGPAPETTDAADLTAGAAGLAVQLDLVAPGELLVRTRARRTNTFEATSVLFTPLRPAHLLAVAADHRIPL